MDNYNKSVVVVLAVGVANSMNSKKWKLFLLDNKDRLDDEEKTKVKL